MNLNSDLQDIYKNLCLSQLFMRGEDNFCLESKYNICNLAIPFINTTNFKSPGVVLGWKINNSCHHKKISV